MRALLNKRRIAAWTTAPLIMTGAVIAGTTVSSDAHTGDLKVTAVCNTQTGQYDLTAKLTLSNVPQGNTGSSMWRIGNSTFDGTPTSATGMDRGPVASGGNVTVTLGSWSLPGTTTGLGPWVYAYTKWSPDNFGKGSDGRLLSELGGNCKQPDVSDALASVSTTPATCTQPEKLVLGQAVNATWGTPTRTTGPGNYSVTATGNAGPPQHLFPAGPGVSADGKTKTFTGTLMGVDTSQNCWAKDATAAVTVTPGTCSAPGSASVTGLQNAVLVGTLDQSVGSHVATFNSNNGHLFGNGTDTLQVSYTVPGKDMSEACNPPSPPTPTKVRGAVKKLDKCGSHNFFYARKVQGAHYTLFGKTVREGVWIQTHRSRIVLKLVPDNGNYVVTGKHKFVVKYPNKRSCNPVVVAPPAGA